VRLLLPLVLASTLASAQQSSPVPPPAEPVAASPASEEELPLVVRLATRKVTLPAAQLPLSTLEGKDVRLGDFDARVVVVVLWSTLFPEQPALEQLEALCRGYRDRKDVACLAINIDMPRRPEDFELLRQVHQEVGASHPFLVDKELQLLALTNERYRPAGMERNAVRLPGFLLFTRGFTEMERVELPREADTSEAVVTALRAAVEQARRRK
jgi:hypothetical protein